MPIPPLRKLIAFAALVLAAHKPLAFAQNSIKAGTIDVTASVGGTFDFPGAGAYAGICTTGTTNCAQQLNLGPKSDFVAEGKVAVAINRFLWLYGDYDYLFPNKETASATLGASSFTTTTTRHYWIATGGVEVSFPTVHRIVPVLRLGGGDVYNDYNFSGSGVKVTPSTIFQSSAPKQLVVAGTFGGGIKWYPKHQDRQGVRVMIEAFYLGHAIEQAAAPFSGGGAAFVSRRSGGVVTVGYFRQFGRR